MTKLTFAEKMIQDKSDRKRNIKLSVNTSSASTSHVRCQQSLFAQPLTPTQIKIQENENRIEEIREYTQNQYKTEGYTPENLQERKELSAEETELLRTTHYLRNPQRTPEMDEGSDHECGGKYQHLPSPIIKSNETGDSEFDNRPNTFGDFEAEWDAEAWF